jgi:nucleotide-binding universal stress UspA family protein
MFQVILVPIDRSPYSEVALAHAVSMAGAFDARLILLHVVDIVGWANPAYSVNPLDWQIRKAEAEAYLQARAAQLRDLGLQAEWHILEGDAAEQTREFIRAHAVDLVVLGARGQSPVKEWNLGSVAFKIAQYAGTSFLLVRAPAAVADQPVALEGVSYQRVLLPLDGSPRAECVLPVAAALSRKLKAPMLLACVVRRPEMPRRTPLTQEEMGLSDAVVESNRLEAERHLAALKDRLPGEVENRVLISADPVFTLHQLAQQGHIDLIVLSAHGYSNQAAWPYGGLTANFIAHGATSVFVVQDTA